jgi:hypothetical protein
MATGTGEQIGEQTAKPHLEFHCKSITCGSHSVDASPFFLPEIPAPRGILADGLADAVAPLDLEIGVFPAISVPEPSLISVWLAGIASIRVRRR